MTVVFDLDYTLLDTGEFKRCLCEALGITGEDFKAHSVSLFSDPAHPHYDLDRHIAFLADGEPDRAGDLHDRCRTMVHARMDSFLFPESGKVVRRFHEAGWQVHLMTLGAPAFQEWKVSGLSTILPYFHRTIYVGTRKVEFLADYAKSSEKAIFVNDNARESLEILGELPSLKLALIDGGYCDNAEHNLKRFKLDQITPCLFAEEGW